MPSDRDMAMPGEGLVVARTSVGTSIRLLAVCWFALAASGCSLGPKQIEASRLRYNESIQRTFQEEILLNLVRLKYRETPKFMTVGGVAAQYSWNGNASLGTSWIESGPDILTFNGGIEREERPTIAYTPLESGEFSRGLLSPVSVETLALLTRTGWSWERIFRILILNVNQIDNATSAGGPTPKQKPEFEQFRYLTQLLRQLQLQRAVEIAQVEHKQWQTLPRPVDQMDGSFLLNSLEQGYRFGVREDGSWGMYRNSSHAALIFSPMVLDSPEVTELVAALNLQPGLTSYEIKLAQQGQIQPALEAGQSLTSTVGSPPGMAIGTRTDLTISTRSLLEAMLYLSHAIDVPLEHRRQGLVTTTLDEAGQPFDWTEMTGDLLHVRVAEHRPKCTAVAIPYRGYWYYIDDRDLDSQSTFALLVQLFSIEIRGGGGRQLPVFTLGI